ncbi:MAG: hypothetical protein N2205_09180 [Candidatus Caldatribacterium sp.]|nr:hypothetical protein [Candidatus Caldatribacterium sp.]
MSVAREQVVADTAAARVFMRTQALGDRLQTNLVASVTVLGDANTAGERGGGKGRLGHNPG